MGEHTGCDEIVLLCIFADLKVPLCILVSLIVLPYMMVDGVIVVGSWGSQINWEKFLVEEFPSD
jgi:hypothetical protein